MRCCSWKCDRIARSALAAEAHAFVSCFDFAFALKRDLKRIMDKTAPAHMLRDSKCLFDTITRLSGVTEKRLLIDISAMREACSKAEMSNVGHAPSEYNLADGLAKKTRSRASEEAMETGKLSL